MAKRKNRNKNNVNKPEIQRPELGREIASTGDGRDITKPYIGELSVTSDTVLQNRSGGHLKIYESVLSDEEVKSSLTQRQDAVVSREYKIDAGGERPIDIEAADFAREQVEKIGFDRITKQMHYGIFYGYAVAELIYGVDGAHIGWERVAVRNRRRFRYSQTGELRLLTRDNQTSGEPCRAPYFWHYATGADNDDEFYGIGLAHWLYWPTLFKRNTIKFWLIFLDKFGMPTTIGRHPTGATPEQKRDLLEITQAVQTDTGIILPEGMTIELLNAARSGTADYKSMYDAMNNAIQRVVVGQTASSGGTPGRLGNEQLQSDVLTSIAKSDADLICESFNRGPLTWLTQMNFPGAEPPKISRIFEEPEDLTARANREKIVYETTGYRPTLASVQDTYGGEWTANADNNIGGKTPTPSTEFSESQPTTTPPFNNVPGALAPRTADVLQPSVDRWINQIREIVDRVNSLEELRDELNTLLPAMSLDDYAEAMSLALSAAALAGRYEIVEEVARGR